MHILYFAIKNITTINSIVFNNNNRNELVGCSSRQTIGELCLSYQEFTGKNAPNMISLKNRIRAEKNFNIKFKPSTS